MVSTAQSGAVLPQELSVMEAAWLRKRELGETGCDRNSQAAIAGTVPAAAVIKHCFVRKPKCDNVAKTTFDEVRK